jgi:U5 small nuclear ribonucleoprotein component
MNNQDYISPVHDNVIFASSLLGTCFSLHSFAQLYLQRQMQATSSIDHRHGASVRANNKLLDVDKFSKFLWGDIFYNFETRKFSKQKINMEAPRSFVHFILEPFYKIISLTLTKDKTELLRIMKSDLGGI